MSSTSFFAFVVITAAATVSVTIAAQILSTTPEPGTFSTESPVSETCHNQIFQASCAADEVIWMQTALFGRLKLGRCIQDNQAGYPLNCTLDVKPEMDSLCSGRKRCEVRIDDDNFRRPSPCPVELKQHLWASYQCRKVIVPEKNCRQTGSSYTITRPITSEGSWLASQTTEETGCGLTETPWIIQVGPGQRINVTMYDTSFDALSLRHGTPSGSSSTDGSIGDAAGGVASQLHPQSPKVPFTCRVFATIREPSRGTTSTICGSMGRIVNVFTSDGDRVEVRVMTTPRSAPGSAGGAGLGAVSSAARPQDPYFMMHFAVIGCAELTPSPGDDRTSMRRVAADKMAITCVGSDLSWTLTCVGNEWIGTYGNCSLGGATTAGAGMYPFALSGVVVIIIAIFVSSVILLIGIICIKWRMKTDMERRRRQLCLQPEYDPAAYGLSAVMQSPGGAKSRMYVDGSYAGVDSINEIHVGNGVDMSYPGHPLTTGSCGPGGRNEYARMRLQRLGRYVGEPGPTGYGFDQLPVSGVGMYATSPTNGHRLAPRFAEHIYESPDTLRRDHNGVIVGDGHYTPTMPCNGMNDDGYGTGGHTDCTAVPSAACSRFQQQHQKRSAGCDHWPPPPPEAHRAAPGCQVGAGQEPSSAVDAPSSRVVSPTDGSKNSRNKSVGNYSL